MLSRVFNIIFIFIISFIFILIFFYSFMVFVLNPFSEIIYMLYCFVRVLVHFLRWNVIIKRIFIFQIQRKTLPLNRIVMRWNNSLINHYFNFLFINSLWWFDKGTRSLIDILSLNHNTICNFFHFIGWLQNRETVAI